MPAVHSKITFDSLNAVELENICTNSKKSDRNVKRKNGTNDEVIKPKKKVVPDLDLKSLDFWPTKKHTNLKDSNSERVSKSVSSAVKAAKNARKRQIEIGNAYSKLNSKMRNASKHLENTKITVSEIRESQTSFYLTPRQDFCVSEFDLENMNPNKLPESFYESELDELIRSQYPDFENTSEYDFEESLVLENFDLPPGNYKPENSLRYFKELLNQEKSSPSKLLGESEIALLKDVVKADERYHKHKKDDYQLLKEILMGQLKEISEQERVIKLALEKIRCKSNKEVKVDSLKVAKAEQPIKDNSHRLKTTQTECKPIKATLDKNSPIRRQEVDVYFRNIPTLEKEILIVKSLCLKLEETLKKATEEKSVALLTLHTAQFIGFKDSVYLTSSKVIPFATKSIIGLAQEFKISHQTIGELKLERDFYIATDFNNFTLQLTNFDTLRHNPDFLLRRLKPFTKDSRLKFNFIEQDPLFFNNFLAKMCNISTDSHATFIPKNDSYNITLTNQKKKMVPLMCGAGDHIDSLFKEEDSPKQELPISKVKSSRSFEKKKIKQHRTPVSEKKLVSAKNYLFKTIECTSFDYHSNGSNCYLLS